jgi:hypothetical protein
MQVVANVPNPPAGQDFTFQPSTSRFTRVKAVRAQFAASAVVASRAPRMVFTNNNGDVLCDLPATVIVASQTWRITWGEGLVAVTLSPVAYMASLPDLWLPDGAKIGSVTSAIDVGDQWSGITVTYLIDDDD